MLRLTFCFLITSFLFVVNSFVAPQTSGVSVTRVTNTPEHAVNLNPTLSDDGKILVFESSADLAGTGASSSFHAVRRELTAASFEEIGATRVVSPALSSDGKIVVFASREDLVGRNADRNSEIFVFDGVELEQLTETMAGSIESRLSDGNFQPSVTGDGGRIVFVSNRDLATDNTDFRTQIFLYDRREREFVQLTNNTPEHVVASPKISADGSRVYYKRNADLVVVETQTRAARVIVSDVAELSLFEGRVLSNDGMRLVYLAATGTNQSQVFLFDGRDNSIRQLTQLGSRVTDVQLQPTISGDGRRVAFATRRRVTNASNGSVELYVLDLPTGQIEQITNAPAAATAQVTASLNFDGSSVAFSFPRVLSGTVADDDLRNNSEIYFASIPPRPIGVATVSNAAARGNELDPSRIAPGSIASLKGNALSVTAEGTTVTVNGQSARLYYASPDEVIFVVPDSLPDGPAEFLVTNSEGLSSKAMAVISATAPGIFTASGDGRGEAIILNSDTLTTGPFDPSNGQLRLSIFATGVARANNLSVTINSNTAMVEKVAPSSLTGLDEIHILVPADLRGAGRSALIVTADALQSNSASVLISGPTPSPSPTPTPTPTPTPIPSPSASPGIVITQVFGGGGNAGAPFSNDFIEIFNRSNVNVDLSGWSVQYASATAATWSVTPLTGITLSPGQFCLIQQRSGGSNGVALPTPDATGTIAMAAGAGKVALVSNSTVLSGTCPNNPNIIDLVGYGNTANCFRGAAPAPAASNTNAILRAANGCTDARNNVADFILGPPTPRNTSFSPRICAN